MNKPIEQDRIDRTMFGMIANLDVLFSQFAYVEIPVAKRNTDYAPPGMYFLSSEHAAIKPFADPRPHGPALHVRPLDAVRDAVKARCCEGRIGSFSIMVWPDTGYALVMANDRMMIANPWVAFVPVAALPTINPDNTERM